MNCKALAVSKSGRTLKTLLTAIVVFASMITGIAQVPSYVPTNGLVGWWPFNGNANDESGNGNNGTVNGATLISDRNGVANAAYSFSGSSIQIPLTQLMVEMPARTISIWFNSTTGQTGGRLFEATNVSWGSGMYNQDMIDLWYQKSNQAYNAVGYTIPNQNTWNNLVFICDSINQSVKVYLNGNIIHNSTPVSNPGSPNTYINQFLKIGLGLANEAFVGYIDDIGIWNRALTQQEITNLYTASTSPPCNPLAANLQNGLVGYWPFCGNANDESGNGNNGTVNGATLTTDRFGAANSAFSFDGVNDFIEVIGYSDTLYEFTISLWFDEVLPGFLFDFGDEALGGANSFSNRIAITPLYVNNSIAVSLDYNYGNVPSSGGSIPYSATGWRNVITTWDGDSLKLFLNNQYLGATKTNVSEVQLYLSNIKRFGSRYQDIIGYQTYFGGKIDDVCMWNRALNQNEITQLYTGSPCVNYQIITVTDTLIINANLSGINPVTFQHTIKVYPNPSSSQITIDFGANFNTLAGYTMRIQNAVGQTVYTTGVTQQQFTSNLNTWTGNGIYFVYLIDAQGNTVDVKKIILQ